MAMRAPEMPDKEVSLTSEAVEEIRERFRRTVISLSADTPSERPDARNFLMALPDILDQRVRTAVKARMSLIREKDIPEEVMTRTSWDADEKREIVALEQVLDEKIPGWDKGLDGLQRFT